MTWHDIGCPVQDRISWWDTPSSRTTGFSQNASTERVVPVTDLENHKMMTSWVPGVDPNSDFSLANIPFGIISVEDDPRDQRAAVAIGTYVLDLGAISAHPDFLTIFPCLSEFSDVFTNHILNPFATLGRQVHRECRAAIQDLLSTETRHPEFLRDNAQLRQEALLPQSAVVMHLPMEINDYTDFYAGYHHAHAVGALFRGPGRELQPNYTHLPVAYTGRKSSVVVTGASIRRPRGQILFKGSTAPTVALTRCLDFELELGCFMAKHNQRGTAVKVDDAEDKIFGYVLLNDWSARDIQQWEYVPLGPFNGKNFATTISPWVVLADALEPFRTTPIENKTPLQEYLKQSRKDSVFDIQLEVELTSRCPPAPGDRCIGGANGSSARGRHHDALQNKLQTPDVVVPADDCPSHARRLYVGVWRSAGVRHHQRAERRRARQSSRDDGGRQERSASPRRQHTCLP
ncbi:Fumarylacetoacetase [Diplogelasinospora grovesii]|uniref:Fumarylacetoacetase n=1 Tax=Diplogelasinospora grovesii TaxID=303347 RepID=A0AAN6S132_9PEZI|nr:Fumarylacetoacetase [Diplogelasinospora grovesii]